MVGGCGSEPTDEFPLVVKASVPLGAHSSVQAELMAAILGAASKKMKKETTT